MRTAAETLKTTGTMCAAAHIVIYLGLAELRHPPTLREFSCEIRLAGRDGDELDINERATTHLEHADMNVLASKARRPRGGASIGTLP